MALPLPPPRLAAQHGHTFYAFQPPQAAEGVGGASPARPSPPRPVTPMATPPAPVPSTVEPPERKSPIKWKALGRAGLLMTTALLLHRLPKHPSANALVSSDWKDWARIFLGIAAVEQINKGFRVKPPVWVSAIETVGVINPLMLGFTTAGARQAAVMAPLVGAMVQGIHTANETVAPPLKQRLGIPEPVTQLGLALGAGVLGVKTYPKLFAAVGRTGLLGAEMREKTQQMASQLGAGMVMCARGCCPSLVCMSEIGEFFGAMGQWLTGKHPQRAPSNPEAEPT